MSPTAFGEAFVPILPVDVELEFGEVAVPPVPLPPVAPPEVPPLMPN